MKQVYILALSLFLFSCGEKHEDDEGMGDDDATVEEVMPTSTELSSTPPEVVTTAFAADYHDAENPQWMVNDGMYKVTFTTGNTEMHAVYMPDGSRYMTEIAISQEMLPKVVSDAAGAMGTITNTTQRTMADGTVQYGIKVADRDYIFDETGSMIDDLGADDNVVDRADK